MTNLAQGIKKQKLGRENWWRNSECEGFPFHRKEAERRQYSTHCKYQQLPMQQQDRSIKESDTSRKWLQKIKTEYYLNKQI